MTRSAIAVRCSDDEVRAALEEWLGGLRLAAPPGLALDVSIDAGPFAQLPDPVFEQPGVGFARGPNDRGIRISWSDFPADADIAGGARSAAVRLSPAAVAELDYCTRTFLLSVVIVLLRHVGWYHLHAATAIDPESRGWLVAGDAHAGKSTTAALLAAAGWQVGTDDIAFLEYRDDRVLVHTCHAPIALRDGGRRLLARAGGVALPDRGKTGFWPEDLGGVWTPLVLPEIVIFTTVGKHRTTAAAISRSAAVAELVRWSAWVILEPDLAQVHLDTLTRLTSQARCYRVTLGRDLFARPNRLIELVT